MTARALGALFLAVAVFSSATSCSRQGTANGPTGELRISLPINPMQLNGILDQNTVESFVDGLIYSPLVSQDDRHDQIPMLASEVPTVANGGITKDGLTITYHLRHGVKWHDGAAFTSADVKFSWQAMMNPNNNVLSRRGYDLISSIDTPDAYTVAMHMKRVFAPAIDTIFGESDTPFFILPAHLLAKYPSLNQVPFNAEPVGTGPYKFARWLRGDRIVLTANPEYFLGAPKTPRLTLSIVLDGNTVASELRSHEIDLAIEISAPTYHNLAGASGVVRQLVEAPQSFSLVFNTQRPPLNDLRVRRALVFAIDRASITRQDTYGAGTLATADLGPYYWAFDRALSPAPYDVATAKSLLGAAGWRAGPDGVRTKNGERLSLLFVYGEGSEISQSVAVQVQQMLRQIGVPLQLKSFQFATLYAAAQSGGIYNGGKFDVGIYPWVAGADPDNSSQWTCAAQPPAGNNVTHYCSFEMDAAQRSALSTFDRSVRERAYSQIERLLLRDAPAAFVYYSPLRYAHSPALKNFSPNGSSEGWNAQDWSL